MKCATGLAATVRDGKGPFWTANVRPRREESWDFGLRSTRPTQRYLGYRGQVDRVDRRPKSLYWGYALLYSSRSKYVSQMKKASLPASFQGPRPKRLTLPPVSCPSTKNFVAMFDLLLGMPCLSSSETLWLRGVRDCMGRQRKTFTFRIG